jgi:hypothetical protein
MLNLHEYYGLSLSSLIKILYNMYNVHNKIPLINYIIKNIFKSNYHNLIIMTY